MKEINFKDRVPTYPGRILLTSAGSGGMTGDTESGGNIDNGTVTPGGGYEDLFPLMLSADADYSSGYYVMERADEPIEQGTPIDKALFNSIIHSRLTGRYYPVTASSVVSDTKVSTVSPLPKSSWTLDGNTRAKSGAYEISASSVSTSDYSVEKALDGKTDTSWSSADGTEHTYTIKLPVALEVRKIKFMLGQTGSSYFTTKFQGSTNGEDWNDLLTISEVPGEMTEYTLTNTADYIYYRFHFTRGSSSRCYIMALEFSEYANNTHINIFTSEEMPAVWDEGQIVLIQTPVFQLTSVIANIFNGVSCNTVLQSNKRYELRYNGTSFDAREV